MPTTSTLRGYLDSAGELPPDTVIGSIVMFTICDTPIERSELEDRFNALGLNPALLPPEIQPLDAFKKATSEAKDRYDLPGGCQAFVLCRDVTSASAFVVRQITREVKDSQRRQLSYAKAIECTFYRATNGKGTERVHIMVNEQGLDDAEKADVARIAAQITERYKRYYTYLDGNRVRAVVRDYLKFLNATELRAGVYFVHASRSAEVDKLRTLVDGIGNGCFMQTLPLIDLPAQRQMVIDAFQRESAQKLNEIVSDIAELRSTRKTITPSAYAKLKERLDVVMAQADEYRRTLALSKTSVDAAAEVAVDSLVDLAGRMLKEAS